MGAPLKNYVLAAGGSLADGVVLQKIAFWCSLNAKRGKGSVTALSLPDLADQLGCSIQAVRYSTERLVKAGLLTKEVKRFSGDRVSHWAVTKACRSAITDCGKPQTGLLQTTDRNAVDHRPERGKPQTLYSEQLSEQCSEHPTPSDPADPSGDLVSELAHVSEKFLEEGKDAVALMKDVKPRPLDKSKKGLTSKSAEAFWKDAWAEHRGTFCPSLLEKDRKALVVLATACAEAGMEFGVFLSRAFSEWSALAAHAKANGGAYSIPSVPTIHWMVQWRQAVFAYLLTPATLEGADWHFDPTKPAEPMQSIANEPPAEEDVDDEKPATVEELLKIMAEDE